MKNDFELIVHKLDEHMPYVNVYPLGDLHIGSKEFDLGQFLKWRKLVERDPKGRVVLIGDMIENGLKTSKTNTYEGTMSPFEQKQTLMRLLEPIKNKIIGAVQGNHEHRSKLASDDCPLYDVMAKLDLEDLYRENMAFIKLNVGKKNKERQYSYTMVLGHGSSRGKTENFSYAIDGMDVLVTGHTHQATSRFPSKIVIDSKNEVVSMKGYAHVTVPSFATFGGYALKGMYLPQDSNKFPVIRLGGQIKGVDIVWM